jgi:hypothetical protein
VVLWSGRNARSHSQQVKDELTQSYEHLMLAAGHAAGGAAEMMTPPYDKARTVANRGWGTTRGALAPLYEQIRDGAANARKTNGNAVVVVETKKKTRMPMLFGLLAAGAAVGAAGAIAARRRRAASEWDEYEPLGGIDSSYGMSEGKGSATSKLSKGAASVAGSVSSGASKLADSLHSKSGRAGDTMSSGSEQMTDKMTDPSRHNSRP